MTVDELVKIVISESNGYVSFPFNKDLAKDKIVWHIIKHRHNDKIYGMVFEKEQHLYLNVKLTIEHGQELRQLMGVTPGYHMNKVHWNTINVNQTELSHKELLGVIRESVQLTK